MKFEDVITLTKQALAQSMGDTYMSQLGDLAAVPANKLIDIGVAVTDMDNTTEKFTKALISLIGNYELMQVNVKDEFGDLFVDQMEWGGFLERAYYGLAEFIEDPMWNTVNGTSYADIEHTFYQPNVSAKIFNECKAGMIPISIQRDTLKEAFRSFEELNRYVAGIHAQVQNTYKMVKKAYARMCVAVGIAESVQATNTAVHLVTEAIAAGILNTGDTYVQALKSKEFKAFMCRRIAEVRDYMKVESTQFNNGTILASADDVRMKLLSTIAKDLRFSLRADTFNENLLSFGEYEEVTCWQGVTDGTGHFDFDSLSKIMIAADADNKLGLGTSAVTISSAIAILYDRRALGFAFNKLKTTSNYTSCADFWNEFLHIWVNMIVDTNCPIVAFILD